VLSPFLEWLGENYRSWDLVHHETMREKPARLKSMPPAVDARVRELVTSSGIDRLYSHQAEAIRLSLEGRNVVLSTNTASGKTLAYQVPVLDRLIRDRDATSLLLFPLKALERDQKDSLISIAGDSGVTAAVYDGDTPDAERRKIRSHPPRVLITNPDMLHLGLLAFHDSWKNFFGRLAFVVLDEVHTYKGIFGTHIAQVLLRLQRVCRLHGATPRFVASSATVANPGEFVSTLIGSEVAVVDRSGAPSAERHFIFLNPVLSPYTVAAKLFVKALDHGLKTIVFTRARKITELITTWVMQEAPRLRHRISSYRAGFLPEERRSIEAMLFAGRMDGVISTSALEMGINVGGLDLCILVGYPGTVINTWQRGGRVGRGERSSAVLLIAGSDALDQYFMRNPRDFFERNCEQAVLDPFNVEVLRRHLPCAAAETPILREEEWTQQEQIATVLNELEETGELYRSRDGALHSRVRRPHRDVDLRGIGQTYSIFLEDRKSLIGTSSGARAFTECHEGAVYLHRARQFLVTTLDLERRNVLVKPSRLQYYTRALSEKNTEILGAPIRRRDFPGYTVSEARLKVTERITSYEKRRTAGQELIGVVDLDLPALHFETVGIWIEIPEPLKEHVKKSSLNFMGGIHAMEHAAISMFPLFALCDRDDIGGISTPDHEQVCRAAVFIYDGHPGGVGLSHRAFDVIEELLEKTLLLVSECACEEGCPSCIHSPKCGSGNKPLDKRACLMILELLLHPEKAAFRNIVRKRPGKLLFPDAQPGSDAHRITSARKGDAIMTRDGRVKGSSPEDGAPSRNPSAGSSSPARTRKSGGRTDDSRIITVAPEPLSPVGIPHEILPDQNPAAAAKGVRRRVVVFDLETQKLAQDVGGWKNISKMRLSLGVAFTEEDGFLTFVEENVSDLVALLKRADLIVGFNHLRFDYEVLRPYTNENLKSLPNLDILVDVQAALGHRLGLDHLAEFTLGKRKSGSGLDASRWFQEGKMDLIEEYCRDDVRLTRDLYRFGLENGFLVYQRKDRAKSRIRVDWKNRRRTG